MPDFKDKKTLDEILSDLNKILDRMPDLTQKLKAPEIKPIDFSSIIENKIATGGKDSQETEDIQLFSENEKLTTESHLDANNEKASDSDHIETLQADLSQQETPLPDDTAIIEVQKNNGQSEYESQNKAVEPEQDVESEDKIPGNTADFGVPDVDFLLNLEQSYSKKEGECENDLVGFQDQPEKKDLDGGEMEDKNQGKGDFQTAEENLKTGEKSAQLEPEIGLNPDDRPEGSIPDSDLRSNDLPPNPDSEVSLQADLEKIDQPESEIVNEASEKPDDASLPEKTIAINPSEVNFQNSQKIENDELNLDLDLSLDSTVKQEQQQEQVYGNLSDMDDELEKFTLAVNEKNPDTANSSHPEDKSIVFDSSLPAQQGEDSNSQGEKTLLFSPDEKDTMPQSDKDFSMDKPPDSIPSERIKNVGFIFSDRNMLNNLLKTLDEICFASKDKPMFVNRSFIYEYSQEFNSNFINQKAAETSCQAVVSVGELPHEKVYELETVFSSAGIIFRHFKPSDFSRSQAIDFVLDLIAK